MNVPAEIQQVPAGKMEGVMLPSPGPKSCSTTGGAL